MSEKIIILRFSALGDVAMLVPVMRLVKQQYPDIRLKVYTKKPFHQIFELADIQAEGVDLKSEYKGIFGLRQLAKEIDEWDPAIVLDMHAVLRTFILNAFCGTKFYRLHKARKEKAAMIKSRQRPENALLSMHERYAQVLDKAGIKVDFKEKCSPISIKHLPQLPFEFKDSSLPFIGIAPFSAHSSKEYPIDKMRKVIQQILDEKSVNILLFGGGTRETEELDALAGKFDNVHSTAGKLNLKDQVKWMGQLALMLSMDSGNGHLAAMMGVKVITIWGATHPYLGFQPFGQKAEDQLLPDATIYPKIPVSVYGKINDTFYKNAIQSIDAKQIADKVISALKD